MPHRLSDIADAIGARLEGDGDIVVVSLAEPAEAGPDDLALCMQKKYADDLKAGAARAAVLWDGADPAGFDLDAMLFVKRPRLALHVAAGMFAPEPRLEPGVHPTAHVDPTAVVGADAAIGPMCVVGAGAAIGRGARLIGQVWIGAGARVGDDCLIHPQVHIGERVRIGDRFIAQSGARIGTDGFSFVTPEKSTAENVRENLGEGEVREQSWLKIESLGGVEIGDDVEVGAGTCIDAGTIRATSVGSGTKIDNQVHIAHNCRIGRDCLLCGQVGMAGSADIGDRVVLAGQVGVGDNVRVGADVVAGGASVIMTSVPAGRAVLGHPAHRMEDALINFKHVRRLPRLAKQVAEILNRLPKSGADG